MRPMPPGQTLIGIRPQQLLIGAQGPSAMQIGGSVVAVETLGPETLVHFRPDGGGDTLIGTAAPHDIPTPQSRIIASAAPGALHQFDLDSQNALGRR